MKNYKQILALTLVLFSSSLSFATAEEYDCTTNNMMELMGLSCVSCGVQKYYSDKGQDKVPSDKWLALLAVNARAFRDTNPGKGRKGTDDIVRSDVAKANLQKVIISQIQAYGFCQEYFGKNTARTGRTLKYRAMGADDWAFFKNYITNDQDQTQQSLGKAAKEFGFQGSSGFFGNGGTAEAYRNMEYMMNDIDYRTSSLETKRSAFREKVAEALGGTKLVALKDGDDQGLRNCLMEIQDYMMPGPSNTESFNFCKSMANSCEVDAGFCSEGMPKLTPAKATGSGKSKGDKIGPPPGVQ